MADYVADVADYVTEVVVRVFCERDSSGTTEGQAQRSPKVMERIARRERAKHAKRLAQILLIRFVTLIIFCIINNHYYFFTI